ncbi:Z1 domain-containing protein [Cellulomonas gelida]|uniref:Z1 domain-containing protein n=1 Tax=Cellulomonas gelida TaxID=1712 RepID=UPI00360E6E80
MSRGLTLEGLLTTLFTRRSSAPLADTQMQMQRWFGYRGAYIDLCRVFLSRAQLELFTRYADADHALRSQVLAAMQSSGVLPDFTVLQGHAFQATGKISGLTGKQLRPGSRPFVRHLNPPRRDGRQRGARR